MSPYGVWEGWGLPPTISIMMQDPARKHPLPWAPFCSRLCLSFSVNIEPTTDWFPPGLSRDHLPFHSGLGAWEVPGQHLVPVSGYSGTLTLDAG